MLNEVRVNEFLGHCKGLVGPDLEFTGVKVCLIDRVETSFGLGRGGVVFPVRFAEGEGVVTGVRVQDRVPEGVKAGDTSDAGVNPFGVSTLVTLRVL